MPKIPFLRNGAHGAPAFLQRCRSYGTGLFQDFLARFFRLTGLIILAHLPHLLSAQIDTIITTPQVEITAAKVSKTSHGSFVQTIDKQHLASQSSASLADLLAAHTGIFFKTYGQGSLATSAFRGAGAGHTALLWNGFSIQNPMNGVLDFSLFPVWLFDAASVQHGGGGSLQGSGAIGGAVFLNDEISFGKGWGAKAGTSVGSFGDFRQMAALSFSGEKAGAQLKFIHASAQNDFPVALSGGQRLQNAALGQFALSQNNSLKINQKQTLNSFLWLQRSDREIPPSRTESNAHAKQEDEVARLGLEWTRVGEGSVTKARAAWLHEGILYFSDLIDSSQSRSNTYIAEAEQACFFQKNKTLRFGLHLNRQLADTKETGPQERTRTALFASWQQAFLKEKLTWSLDARQELTDGKPIPIVASTGADFRLGEALRFHARIAKNYNLPTFNDLYWSDPFAKGNPDLRPETAWGEELGVHYQRVVKNFILNGDLTAFHNLVQNWILWSPQGNIFQPDNKRTVRARGAEFSFKTVRNFAQWQLAARLNAAYTRSTVERIYENDDPRFLDKQLIYNPLWNGSFALQVQYLHWSMDWLQQYTGKRYTSTDNSERNALPGFTTTNLTFGRTFGFPKSKLSAHFSVLNLFNTRYEVLAARPMPGRHFQISLRYEGGVKSEK